jgi:hypothetical protein
VPKPEEVLHFIQLEGFAKEWEGLRLNNDEDLQELEIRIMNRPTDAPVIRGTGGLRKLRYAPKRWSIGKRGAIRVCYVFLEDYGVVLLITAYAKTEKGDIPPAHRKAYRQLIDRIKKQFATKTIR